MQIAPLNQLVSKLQPKGAEYVVAEHGNGTLVQTGRFGYLFNEGGKLNGGWIWNRKVPLAPSARLLTRSLCAVSADKSRPPSKHRLLVAPPLFSAVRSR